MIAPEIVGQFAERQVRYTGGEYRDETFRYRLLSPSPTETGKKYPLMLFLHGAGERGDDNRAQLKYLPTWMAERPWREKFACHLLAPQCRVERTWAGRSMRDGATDQMKVVIQILDELLTLPTVDARRVYLTGLSMGGFGSWELASLRPKQFAALAPICGGGNVETADAIQHIPTWAIHGADDDIVPVSESRVMIAALRHLGARPRYTEFTQVGHDSWTPAYKGNPERVKYEGDDPSGFLAWIFAQRRGDA